MMMMVTIIWKPYLFQGGSVEAGLTAHTDNGGE